MNGGFGMNETCKRGLHPRNAETNRRRTVTSGGKTREINECLACAAEAKARKAAPPVPADAA